MGGGAFNCITLNFREHFIFVQIHESANLGMESKSGENFLSLQCKDKGEGGGLKILLVKIAIHK